MTKISCAPSLRRRFFEVRCDGSGEELDIAELFGCGRHHHVLEPRHDNADLALYPADGLLDVACEDGIKRFDSHLILQFGEW